MTVSHRGSGVGAGVGVVAVAVATKGDKILKRAFRVLLRSNALRNQEPGGLLVSITLTLSELLRLSYSQRCQRFERRLSDSQVTTKHQLLLRLTQLKLNTVLHIGSYR